MEWVFWLVFIEEGNFSTETKQYLMAIMIKLYLLFWLISPSMLVEKICSLYLLFNPLVFVESLNIFFPKHYGDPARIILLVAC